jgi:hypothetical protein
MVFGRYPHNSRQQLGHRNERSGKGIRHWITSGIIACKILPATHHNGLSPLLHLKSLLNEALIPRMKPASFAGTSP